MDAPNECAEKFAAISHDHHGRQFTARGLERDGSPQLPENLLLLVEVYDSLLVFDPIAVREILPPRRQT